MVSKPSTMKETGQAEDIVTCGICLRHFVDPRLLPCMHTYCFGCIQNAASRTKGDFICPLDKTILERNQINSLRVNFAILEILQSLPKVTLRNSQNPKPEAYNDSIETENTNTSAEFGDNEDRQIFITDLPVNMSEQSLFDTLLDEFTTVGEIKIDQQAKPCIHLFKRVDNKYQLNGTAAITFQKEESVKKAIEKCNRTRVQSLNNAQIFVRKTEVTNNRKLAPTPPSAPSSKTSGSKPNSPPKSIEIKIWVQFEGCPATRETLDCTSIIDDLTRVALNREGRKNEYQAHYRNRDLGPGEPVPSDTESDRPIVLRKITKLLPKDPNPSGSKSDTLKDYHIVIDNSNVFLGAQTIRNEKTGVPHMNLAIRVDVNNLAKVLEGDKVSINVRTRVVGGSKPPEKALCWTKWESCGYKCILGDRSMKNKVSRIVDNYYIKILVLFVLGKPRGRYATRSNS
ncbi:unnamed protein product [Adineta steineri]|uniref:RING-type domain-containing protein n=1 Tax=Adineta steineri TaxID=433720 RepID=A0A813TVL7_9BILA|nr:unnamed protein product [Adineta steineri]CAF0812384.1 unnamed protein product [Adineta steineri]CAF0819085.1 unnamed protein product [Adineta steineri]